MKVAYIDTSCLVALAFGERGATALARRLRTFDELVSSNLLEAELRGVFAREEVAFLDDLIAPLTWILPDRPLGAELQFALIAGYLRGADLWHVATALYLAEDPGDLTFLTLDQRQRDVAGSLGFPV